MRFTKRWMWCAAAVAAAMLTTAGCSKPDTGPKGGAGAGKKDEHAHEHPSEGPHGGALAEWGEEEYHVEFKVDHAKKEATIYILDGSGKKAPSVGADKITDLKLTVTSVTPPLTLDMKHDPKKSDAKGIAFVATHDQFAKETEFKGNVSGKIGGKDYTGDFEEKEHDHKHEKK